MLKMCLVASWQAHAAPAEPACLKCHQLVGAALQKKVVHLAVKLGCLECHIDHRQRPAGGRGDGQLQSEKAGQRQVPVAGAGWHNPGQNIGRHLKARQPELCLNCHRAQDAKVVAAHRGQPFEKSACTACHDPHSADVPKLIYAKQHGPYQARQCDLCHQAPESGRARLVAATTNELCLNCHGDLKKRMQAAGFQHSLLSLSSESCVDCHDPHATPHERFLKQPVTVLCGKCHAAVTAGRQFLHEPVQRSCVLCHDPHLSQFPRNLHASGNELCLACHNAEARGKLEGAGPVSLHSGRVTLPPHAFRNLKLLELEENGTSGHPLPRHPVSAPSNNKRPEVNCIACHRPHAANGTPHLLVTESPNTSALCVRCHG